MIDVKIFNVTVLMTNCCLLTDGKTGKRKGFPTRQETIRILL